MPVTSRTAIYATIGCCGMALCAALLILAPTADAQNALGDGRALDNNLQEGRLYNPESANSHSAIAREVAYRNALVTGNAANGLSFRESVGYNAEFDFRTDFDQFGRSIPLPSDDTYNFVRDSVASTYPSIGLRGIDAIRQQAAWSTGNLFDEATNAPIIARSASSGADVGLDPQTLSAVQSAFIDPFRLRPGSLRSSTEHAVGSALETRILGQTRNEQTNQVEFLQASPLRGVVSEPVVTDNMIKLFDGGIIGAPDLIQPSTDTEAGPEAFGYDAVVERMSTLFHEQHGQQTPDDETAAPDTSTTPTPGGLDNANPDGSADEAETDPLSRLRGRLLGLPGKPGGEATAETTQDRENVIDAIRRIYQGDAGEETTAIDHLAPPVNKSRNLFAENMRLGESLLASGQWFDAEERFSAALRLNPGDPMAAVGRLHAQLGAGLYLSAGVNFDRIMRANPELMAARYDDNLLPRRGRLQRIDARLRLNTQRSDDQAISCALLMGYIAFQFDDRLTIEDAFAALDRIHKERGDNPDLLETTLRDLWLGQ
ncbi:MAG: hypothetical protein H6813_04585 [Phycisphaeraceae bacterium]|nr:hypothetical protein [Phycisphaeraceae bacterium]MCB9847226.1 hypothetical protein [Phycisphaeraceae bacterium]